MAKVGDVVSKKGQSIIETALILPVIVLIITGIIDFSLIFNNYFILSNASREGARAAATGSDDTEIYAAVKRSSLMLEESKLRVVVEPQEYLRKKGNEVSVIVEYDSNLITPIISAIAPNPVCLKVKTVMRME